MKHKFFAKAAVAFFVATSAAHAADLPSQKGPAIVPYIPPPLWTGFFIGGQAGYGAAQNSGIAVYNSSPSGFIGGAHLGYEYQVNQIVYGFETDIDGSDISSSVFNPVLAKTLGTRVPVQGSVRARVGYVPVPQLLFYATAGGAFADVKHFDEPGYSIASPRGGWTVGGGVEYAITNDWSVRVSYRYADFGHELDVVYPKPSGINHLTENLVQVGFSYKFDLALSSPLFK
jgi:outer membrane immunogenic protein